MHLPLLSLLPLTAANTLLSAPSSPKHIFANPPQADIDQLDFKIPTSYESAILARRILNLTPLGTLSTIFPSSHHPSSSSSSSENDPKQVPSDLEGMPIGLMDYIADCEGTGDPTILAMSIATSFRNVASGSNISLSLRWTPPYPPKSRISLSSSSSTPDTVPYSAVNLPRFSLLGYLEKIPEEDVTSKGVGECFVEKHRDAKLWLPGNRIHASEWARLVVREVYWIGGFGDRAYIGWIPVEEWRGVTREEWEEVRLPGEKRGWKEWAFDMLGFGQWEL
jgi:hypothetical protein